jgi:hypothetical protein
MAEVIGDTMILPVMADIAAEVAAELVRRGLDPITKVIVQPGSEFVVDYAGNGKDCGEIDVNLVQAYPTDNFPEPDVQGNCVSALAFELNVSVMRCAAPTHGTKQNPSPPTIAEQLESTAQHLADMQASRCAIKVVLARLERDYVLQAFTPIGPQGQTVGGTWTVIVRSP